jgi:hypothetical protein
MSQSTASRLMVSDDAGLITNPLGVAFNECSLVGQRTVSRHAGHRGTRQRASCRARTTADKSGGTISGNFAVDEIDWFLPRVLGTTGAAPWTPGETISPFYALVDKVAAIYLYNKQRISSLEISGQETQYLNWSVNCVGEEETTWGVAYPATPVVSCGTAFLFSDCTLTYNSIAYKMQSFRLSIDNAIDANQYENALTPTRFEATDLVVQLQATCALRSDTLALYDAALAGATASLAVSDGTTTYTFNFANLKYMSGGPTVPNQGRINMPLTFEAFRSNTTGTAATDNQIRITKV